ncbi:MAG: hypothetical protein M1522_08260, partial [Actinobacteria bacterium]|nr:hypothetical protein [Actinomycetota bacterium]
MPILALTALAMFSLSGALLVLPETAQASSSPLPPAIMADGTAWQTFVTNGLSAIASHDGSSTASISAVGRIYSGSLVFKAGPNAGRTSFANQTLAGLTTDSSGADVTTFTMLNNTSGLIERYSNCQANAGSIGPSTTGICQVTQYDLGSYSSSAVTSIDTVSRTYSQTTDATSGGSATPGDLSCTSVAYAPGTEASIYGPLITYGGTFYCNAPENLSIIDGLYNDSSDGYIGTGYSTGASGNGAYSVTASGL